MLPIWLDAAVIEIDGVAWLLEGSRGELREAILDAGYTIAKE